MTMLDKDKEYADRIADINQRVQTGDVNFEQASGYALDCRDYELIKHLLFVDVLHYVHCHFLVFHMRV
jgi:hypothetical protein